MILALPSVSIDGTEARPFEEFYLAFFPTYDVRFQAVVRDGGAAVLYTHELDVVPITTPAYRPESNGLAEAFVHTF